MDEKLDDLRSFDIDDLIVMCMLLEGSYTMRAMARKLQRTPSLVTWRCNRYDRILGDFFEKERMPIFNNSTYSRVLSPRGTMICSQAKKALAVLEEM